MKQESYGKENFSEALEKEYISVIFIICFKDKGKDLKRPARCS